jgi:hypothetical protein
MSNIDFEKLAHLLRTEKADITPEMVQEAFTKGNNVQRALTDPTTTPFTTYDVEELQKAGLITTPVDTPLTNILRNRTGKSMSWLFEWNETEIQSNLTYTKYDGYTLPTDRQGSPSRKSNYIMPLATVAKVSRFTNSFVTTDENAMNNEMVQKNLDLNRGIEYYLWNGDSTVTGGATETNGIISLVTSSVDNGGSALSETSLQTAILQISANNGRPDLIFGDYTQAMRIANFAEDRISSATVNNVEGGISDSAMFYNSPFGTRLRVIPVLNAYMPTGKVYVLDSSKMRLRHTMNSLINYENVSITQHGDAVAIFSFMGLELKGATNYHRVITNVANSL